MIQVDFPLARYSSFRIGGRARYFAEAKTKKDLINILSEWRKISDRAGVEYKRIFVLGGGTNLLISDKGWDGLVIRLAIDALEKIQQDPNSENIIIEAGAGVQMDTLLKFCSENSLSGLEWAGGLPGTIGGAIRGNAGAFGGETKDRMLQVESLNIYTLEAKNRDKEACEFDYRNSIFKSGEGTEEIIMAARLGLKHGDKDQIIKAIEEKVSYRLSRHPLEYPNAGSIFKNLPVDKLPSRVLEEFKDNIKNDPFPVLPAAKLLSVAQLMGEKAGGAMVSEKHPNFIINTGGATSADVKNLIMRVREKIEEKYGVILEPEITFVE